MLQNIRQNYHHSQLPKMGSIVILPTLDRPRQHRQFKTYPRYIVESVALCDNVRPYSKGIHLVTVASLADRNQRRTISGFYCAEME